VRGLCRRCGREETTAENARAYRRPPCEPSHGTDGPLFGLDRDPLFRHPLGSGHGDFQNPLVIAGVDVVRTHPLGQGQGPLKPAVVHLAVEMTIPIVLSGGFALALNDELVVHYQDLYLLGINPGKVSPDDELVPLHVTLYRRIPTARPKPGGKVPPPVSKEAAEEGIGVPGQWGQLSEGPPGC